LAARQGVALRELLDDTDEGELTIAITAPRPGTVRIDFGKRVAWFALDTAQEAKEFCSLILQKAGVKFFIHDDEQDRRRRLE
jgi:hypothetical protein